MTIPFGAEDFVFWVNDQPIKMWKSAPDSLHSILDAQGDRSMCMIYGLYRAPIYPIFGWINGNDWLGV